jgi:phosphatidylserine/phosphatidylglycerophosphate/cardiolipin synthase-like enzyme
LHTGSRARRVWRAKPADRTAVLLDGADYFQALLHALPQARSRIMVLGWDRDPRARLDPAEPIDLDYLRRWLHHVVVAE